LQKSLRNQVVQADEKFAKMIGFAYEKVSHTEWCPCLLEIYIRITEIIFLKNMTEIRKNEKWKEKTCKKPLLFLKNLNF